MERESRKRGRTLRIMSTRPTLPEVEDRTSARSPGHPVPPPRERVYRQRASVAAVAPVATVAAMAAVTAVAAMAAMTAVAAMTAMADRRVLLYCFHPPVQIVDRHAEVAHRQVQILPCFAHMIRFVHGRASHRHLAPRSESSTPCLARSRRRVETRLASSEQAAISAHRASLPRFRFRSISRGIRRIRGAPHRGDAGLSACGAPRPRPRSRSRRAHPSRARGLGHAHAAAIASSIGASRPSSCARSKLV